MREQMAALNKEMAAVKAALAANAQGVVPSSAATTGSLTTYGSLPPITNVPTYPTNISLPPPQPYQAPVPQQMAYAAVPPAPPVPPAPTPPPPNTGIPPPTHVPMPAATTHGNPPTSIPMAGPPPQAQGYYQQSYQAQGWGGRGRRGRGAGRGRSARGGYRQRLAYGPQPPTQAYQQGQGGPPNQAYQQGYGGGGGTTQRTYRKHFNNWNMCFSCGFDVPYWHTSKTCPPECRKPGHQEGCDRSNYRQYIQAGHRVRMKKEDAHILPTNPGPHQA